MLTCAFLILVGCQAETDDIAEHNSELSGAAARQARSAAIRDGAGVKGLTNGVLLAGIAQVETGLSHCWSEATWACQGPNSISCGGPVIAGASDGPCSAQQGGLGMFQFDGGTFAQTLARDGEEILELDGNIEHAVDFVTQRVVEEVSGVGNTSEALSWLNSINVSAGDPKFEEWIEIVSCRYNGCCGCSSQEGKYRDATIEALNEFDPGFWDDASEPAECVPVPSSGAVINENDACAVAGGDPQWWRVVSDAGVEGRLLWTHTTDSTTTENYAQWNLDFEVAGTYRVEVHTDGGTYGEATLAAYQLVRADGEDTVVIDQSAMDGWQTLGEFSFGQGPGQWVRVDDNTGEPLAGQTRLQFDALRLTPVDPIDPNDPNDPRNPPVSDDPDNDDNELGGGCQSANGSSPSSILMLLVVGLIVGWRRRSALYQAS